MDYKFSDKFTALKPSIIREILKADSGKPTIPFSAGNPAAESIPADFIRRAAEQILENSPSEALQYGISEGYAPLRQTLRNWVADRYDIDMSENDVIIVSGAQQGIDLSAKIFCNEGDTVVTESPSFIGSLNAFRSCGLKLKGITVNEDGADPDELDRILSEDDRAKLIYLIPTFQNPGGSTASMRCREKLYEVARKHDAMILEDDPYREIRFDGDDVPPIKSIDEDGRVIYCGSFSKVLSAGMRLGFVVAAPEIIAKLVVAKQCTDVHTNMLAQMILDSFINLGNIEGHIGKIRRLYKHKCDLMFDGIERYFPKSVKVAKPEGGLFAWCKLPEGSDAKEVCVLAKEKGVSVVPGLAFAVIEGENIPYIRLNYSTPSDEQIEKGIKILGEVLTEYTENLGKKDV